MTPQEQIDTVGLFMTHFNRGDRAAAIALMHPDITVEVPSQMPYGGTWESHDGIERLMQAIPAAWQDWRDVPYPYEMASVGSKVYREVQFTATLVRTGKQITMWFTEVFTFRGDKIAEIRPYYADPAIVAAG
jgi:ketosteroid isomerase-like protein